MVVQLEAYNYKCLRAVQVPLGNFHILIGRNGSGKSVFMDVLKFLQDAMVPGVGAAVFGVEYKGVWLIEPRAQKDFHDLLHKRQGNAFTFAIVVKLPDRLRREHQPLATYDRLRYQVQVGVNEDGELAVLNEELWLLEEGAPNSFEMAQATLFEDPMQLQDWLWKEVPTKGWKRVIRNEYGDAHFESEVTGWRTYLEPSFDQLALGLPLPQRGKRPQFPATAWLKEFIKDRIMPLQMVPSEMRYPCPATVSDEMEMDGSNLPKVVQRLQTKAPDLYEHWLGQIRMDLRTLEAIEVVTREEDNALYLVLHFSDIGRVPQWAVSDGTLRLLAISLIGYLPDEDLEHSLWLIEEPENGVHPQSLELITQSLRHVANCGGQVWMATHSAPLLQIRDAYKPHELLCFRMENGETIVYRWDERFPDEEPWVAGPAVIFASGGL